MSKRSAQPEPAPTDPIVCRSGLSAQSDAFDAAAELSERLDAVEEPDLLMVFASPDHARRMGTVSDMLREKTGARHIVAVTAEGVMERSVERERKPGLVALSMKMPGVDIKPFWVNPAPSSDPPAERAAALGEQIGASDELRATFLFADPFSVPLVNLVPDLSNARVQQQIETRFGSRVEPVGTILGGLASGGSSPGSNTLLCDGEIRNSGAMGVSLSGPVRVDVVVSQGCRPFGPRMVITKARGNLILELGGRPAVDAIRDAVQELSDEDRKLLGDGLLVGRAIDETKRHLGRGDFLVRQVPGADQTTGAIAISDLVRAGQTIRLHLQDAQTAREDLALLMDGQRLHEKPEGALMISCNLRGERLFGDEAHDAPVVCHSFDPIPDGPRAAKPGHELDPESGIPLAGFFAASEIGPVGNQIFHHGHTAVVGLIRQPTDEAPE